MRDFGKLSSITSALVQNMLWGNRAVAIVNYFHLIWIKWAVEGWFQDEITTFGFLTSCSLFFFLILHHSSTPTKHCDWVKGKDMFQFQGQGISDITHSVVLFLMESMGKFNLCFYISNLACMTGFSLLYTREFSLQAYLITYSNLGAHTTTVVHL